MASMNKLELDRITLIGIDCVDIERLVKAALICMNYCNFPKVKLLTNLEYKYIPGIEFINIKPVNSLQEYSLFVLSELTKYVDTEFALIFQHDGFILNPDAWTDEFLNYDYIGSPWNDRFIKYARKVQPTNYDFITNVGNGGFSLRSKKLLEMTTDNDLVGFNIKIANAGEDVYICLWYGQILNALGIKFAPPEIAEKFSVEFQKWNGSFGFHDKKTDISLWKDFKKYHD